MKITEVIKLLEIFPSDTPVKNMPKNPFYYVKSKNDMALTVGDTIFNQNPTGVLGDFVTMLKGFSENLGTKGDLYLTHGMHQAGNTVRAIEFNTEGIMLVV